MALGMKIFWKYIPKYKMEQQVNYHINNLFQMGTLLKMI